MCWNAEAGVGNFSFAPTFEVAYDFYHRQRNYSLPLTAKQIEEHVRTSVRERSIMCIEPAFVDASLCFGSAVPLTFLADMYVFLSSRTQLGTSSLCMRRSHTAGRSKTQATHDF